MVTPAMGAALMDPMYSLRENGAQPGIRGFHLLLSTLQGSRLDYFRKHMAFRHPDSACIP